MATFTRCAGSLALLLGTAAALSPASRAKDTCPNCGQLDTMYCDAAAKEAAEPQKQPAKAP